jgi:hypothetical protein
MFPNGRQNHLIFDEFWFKTEQSSIYCCLYTSRVSLEKQTCCPAATAAQVITKKKEKKRRKHPFLVSVGHHYL